MKLAWPPCAYDNRELLHDRQPVMACSSARSCFLRCFLDAVELRLVFFQAPFALSISSFCLLVLRTEPSRSFGSEDRILRCADFGPASPLVPHLRVDALLSRSFTASRAALLSFSAVHAAAAASRLYCTALAPALKPMRRVIISRITSGNLPSSAWSRNGSQSSLGRSIDLRVMLLSSTTQCCCTAGAVRMNRYSISVAPFGRPRVRSSPLASGCPFRSPVLLLHKTLLGRDFCLSSGLFRQYR